MKFRRFITVLSVVLIGALALALPAAAAPESAFTGRWYATDPVDGSNLTLTIRSNGDGTLSLRLFDDRATAGCPATAGAAFASGTGTISGDQLTYSGSGLCPSERHTFPFGGTLTYDGAANTLTDSDAYSTTYSRTRPDNPFRGRWQGMDIVDGSTLTLNIAGRPGGTYRLFLQDDEATAACPATAGMAIARGTGSVSGNTLPYTGSGLCPSEHYRFSFNGELTYDVSTDTLTDFDGTVYNRISP